MLKPSVIFQCRPLFYLEIVATFGRTSVETNSPYMESGDKAMFFMGIYSLSSPTEDRRTKASKLVTLKSDHIHCLSQETRRRGNAPENPLCQKGSRRFNFTQILIETLRTLRDGYENAAAREL